MSDPVKQFLSELDDLLKKHGVDVQAIDANGYDAALEVCFMPKGGDDRKYSEISIFGDINHESIQNAINY